MNKEIKYFLLWLLIKGNLIKTIKWLAFKIYYKFINKNYSYKYPYEIYSSLKKLDKRDYINESKNITKYSAKLNNINKIKLASRNLEITSHKIDWLRDFRDSEDIESIHRWNWMIHGISKKNNQISYASKKSKVMDLEVFDAVFIRQDPPFNLQYISNTYLLYHLKKPLIINNPKEISNYP